MKGVLKVISVFIVISLSGFTQSPDAQDYFQKGVTDLNGKDYINAIANFTNALSEKPDYGKAYLQRAIAKQKLAEMAGYESPELCLDLSQALNLGEEAAIPYIKKHCQNECFKMDMAFIEPEYVFCADFSSKVLYDMPKEAYDKLVNLTKLNLFNNKFTTLSKTFMDFNLLTSLDLSSNRFTEIQPVIGYLVYLEELNLNKNFITDLPVEIGKLKNLKNLQLKGNKLAKLPEQVTMLESLEYLDLSSNLLTGLPQNIANWKKLKTLSLIGNEISKKEQERIKSALPNCTIYF